MDTSKFTDASPGRIVQLFDQRPSFLPDMLPPVWQLSNELWPLLCEATKQIALLEGVGRYLPNPALLLRTASNREALRSSKLEGTIATPKELLLFELEPPSVEAPNDSQAEAFEVYNYRKALDYGVNSSLPLSTRLVRDLHRILLTGVRGTDRAPGELRTTPVAIGTDERFIPPPSENVDALLNNLDGFMNLESPSIDGLIDCFVAHYQFETIHPFRDGNGRVGRLLLALMLQKRCQLSKPWMYMSEYYEARREEYFFHLFNVSATGNWTEWIRFSLEGAVKQARDTIARCDSLRSLHNDFMQRLQRIKGNVRINQIVDGLFISPFVRVAELKHRLNVHYNTAKKDLERLSSVGIVRALEMTSEATWYSPEVFRIGYDDH